MKRKIVSLIVVMLMLMTIPDAALAAVTTADITSGIKGSRWEIKLGTGYAAAPTPPLLHGGYLYVGAANRLYKINKETGAIIKTGPALAGNMGYAMFPPVYGNGMIFISVGNGRIQALDANTLAIKWKSEAYTGATNSPITYDEASGNVYFATWNNKNEGGEYICLNASTGAFKWKVAHPDGFYWSGAYIESDHIIFGSESVYGTDNSTIYSVNKNTGATISTMDAIGNIRSTIVGDGGSVYVTTQGSRLYKIETDDDGKFTSSSSVQISGGSTGKPTVLDGKIYFGTNARTIDIYSLSDLTKVDSIKMPGYPQSEFLLKKTDAGNVDIYSTYNSYPGGICRVDGASKTVSKNFFVPAGTQFCTSPLICDDDGTIYYKNDSCYLMAVDDPENAIGVKPSVKSNSYNGLTVSWTKMSGATGYDIYRSKSKTTDYKKIKSTSAEITSIRDTGLKTGTKYYYKLQAKYSESGFAEKYSKMSSCGYANPILGKPVISTKISKKTVKVSWKKVSGASGYVVYRATKKNGKYKKIKTIKKASTKSWTNKKLKSKKKYYYKVKAYRIVSGNKVYSAFSKVSYKKVK